MKSKRKNLCICLAALLASLAVTGCAYTDGPEFVTVPESSKSAVNGDGDSAGELPADSGDDEIIYTTTAAPGDTPDMISANDEVQTYVAVVMDDKGNIITDSSGNPVTTVVQIAAAPEEDDAPASGGENNGSTTDNAPQTGSVMYTADSTVLHEGPSVYAASVAELAADTPITVISVSSDGWCTVSVGSTTGYIPASELKTADDNKDIVDGQSQDDIPAGGTLYARSGAVLHPTTNSNSPVVLKPEANVPVTVMSLCADGWYAVSIGGTMGYMQASDLQTLEEVKATETTTTTVQTTTTTTTTTAKKTTTTAKKTTTTTTAKKTTTTAKKTTTTAKKTAASQQYATSYDATTNEYINEVVRLVNIERQNNGLSPLIYDDDLTKASMIRAKEIVNKFDHYRPNGEKFSNVLKELGLAFQLCGENIAYGYPTPASVVDGWMNSTGHRANILSSDFTHIGIGYYVENGTAYWVQEFCLYWKK